MCLHYTVYSTYYTVYYADHSLVSQKQWEENTEEKIYIKFWINVNFSLGFGNTDYLTNKLQNVHALHCTIVLYIVQSWPELSYLKDSKGRGPDRKVKWWLINILLKWLGIMS